MSAPSEQRWREQLAAWAVPEHIRTAVDESPWHPPKAAMIRRADERIAAPAGVSLARTAQALDPPGSVLDVGAAAGAASLPVAARITELVAVDVNGDLLSSLTARAEALGLPVTCVVGRWPDLASRVPPVDVVVCHHVCYNVPDLADFALALAGHARRRVVVELTERHPMWLLNPYWKILHGVDRPAGPTADDAVAVFRDAGLDPVVERWSRPQTAPADVEQTRRALCLPRARTAELVALMRERPVPASRNVVTLWWPR